MKKLDGTDITYESSFQALESIKNSFHEGEEIITIIEFCQDMLSDPRLNVYPSIEVSQHNAIIFNYENYENDFLCNHLVIKINDYGFNFDDKVLSYFCIKGVETQSNARISWNEVVHIIRGWNKND